jgi:hypothetical protein
MLRMMTRIGWVTLSVGLAGVTAVRAGVQPAAVPDLSRPEAVVEVLVAAANSGETELLRHLCHPDIAPERLDPRALQVCEMTPEHPNFPPFRGMFTDTRLGSAAEITATGELTTARAPMVRASDGAQLGFVNMIEYDGRWYLRGF